jgi:hypothetical protein
MNERRRRIDLAYRLPGSLADDEAVKYIWAVRHPDKLRHWAGG